MSAKRVRLPLTEAFLTDLQAGDEVLLSGKVLTARDAAHQRLFELLNTGKPLPVLLDGKTPQAVPLKEFLQGQVIYYVGPTPAPEGRPIGSAGPTTAERMDKYTPRLLDETGLKGLIGKGWRGKAVREALVRNKAVYFAALTIAAIYGHENIRSARVLAFPDLGTEAIRELEFVDFPVFVVNDIYGNDYYEVLAKEKGIPDPRASKDYHGE